MLTTEKTEYSSRQDEDCRAEYDPWCALPCSFPFKKRSERVLLCLQAGLLRPDQLAQLREIFDFVDVNNGHISE